MPLKTFVARKGLESGGGVFFPVGIISGNYNALENDFFIDCQYAGSPYDVYLPAINNIGEQRQIVVLRNSTGDTTNLVTVYGSSGGPINASTPFIYLKNGQTITFQVNYDYTGWFLTSDYSFIQEDVAVGSTYRILNSNSATGPYSTVSGGAGNTAGILYSPGGLDPDILYGDYATVSGGQNNWARGNHSTVAGGIGNIAGDPDTDNQDQREYTTVSGGINNKAIRRRDTVSGGGTNYVKGGDSTISGGSSNYIITGGSTISGGLGNSISGDGSNISGGGANAITGGASSTNSSIGGGGQNSITNSSFSVISGGGLNKIITDTGNYNVISGGDTNEMNASGISYSNILGGSQNKITGGNYVVMGGGRGNTGGGSSSVLSGGEYNQGTGNYSVLSGGALNFNNSQYSTLSGGHLNRISTNGDYNVISGGYGNTAGAGGAGQTYSVISGGQSNYVVGQASSIVGGGSNSIGGSTTHSFIGGGLNNSIAASSSYSSILGGARNTISGVLRSSIIGGTGNTITHNDSFIIGSSLASKRIDTTHVDNLDVNTTLSYNNYKSTAYSSGEVVYFGTTVTGVGMTAGFIYEYGATGAWGIARADTSANANGLLAIALGSAPSSGMLLRGFASYAAVSSYTAMGTTGGPVYLSKTANQFTQTAPGASGDIIRIIGYCVNPTLDLLYFAPDTTWITLTT